MSDAKVLYSAVVLDAESKDKLIGVLSPILPDGWKIYAHHMTIVFGKGLDDKSEIGKTVVLKVTKVGISKTVIAVGVEGYPSKNKIPHVTVAVNTAEGGESHHSNQIENWTALDLDEALVLSGVVTEIKQ